MAKPTTGEGLIYKGKPLMRLGNLLYYGSMAEKYIIVMQVKESKKIENGTKGELDIASRVLVELQFTSPDLKAKDRVVKKSEKDGLYSAMDLANVWLDRALKA
ncbi:hypothetical protein FACS1894208_05760 [Clostridia bacterium]|nr:hypothetical protein FACS1894208_05760 [Clostridia bacterium]